MRDGVLGIGPFPQVLRHLRAADPKVLVLRVDTPRPQELAEGNSLDSVLIDREISSVSLR